MNSVRAPLLAFEQRIRSRIRMTKPELRRELRALPPLPPDVAAEKSDRICARLVELPAWLRARTVALYAANAHEPDLSALWERKGDRVFCFPRVEGDRATGERLVFHRVDTVADLLLSRWGLFEPSADPAREVNPGQIDLVIVPGVAFTANGERLGRGRGHYDRFLALLAPHAITIGLCFDTRLLPSLPTESHDRRMDQVIAE
jgi:5-formyltetrahydrofolate cyclo-ligase